MCFSGKYTEDQIKKMITGKGGLVSYLESNDAREVSERIEKGDEYAALVYYAMAYQVAKDIGSAAAVLKGKVDAILVTGGIAYNKLFTGWLEEHVSFIQEISVYPGEDELMALAEGGLRVLRGEEEAKVY